jgi:hypothetical protein
VFFFRSPWPNSHYFLFDTLLFLTYWEVVFARMMPEFWPWVPLFIFLPIAIIELDSMRT